MNDYEGKNVKNEGEVIEETLCLLGGRAKTWYLPFKKKEGGPYG